MKTNIGKSFRIQDYNKILIIGSPASGKSTLASKLGAILDIPVIHLDKLYWNPGWEIKPKEEFLKQMREESNKPRWIIDGDYNSSKEERMIKSDLVLYLDYPTSICLESYYSRVENKSIKGFITDGCVEQIDEEFIQFIKDYNKNSRDNNYSLMGKLHKDYIAFENRQDTERFVASLGTELI